MSGYRFCRSDDVSLLVEAYNRCFRPHFPGKLELTVDAFKRLVRGIDLWTSSCMVAIAGDEPIGVLLAGKREHENLVYRIGVHPDHVGREHGSHLLTSLSQKLAILGPRRIVVELPEEQPGWRTFFERSGFAFEGEAALEALLRAFVATATGRVRIPRTSSSEISEAAATAVGFHCERRWAALSLDATPP